MKKHAATSLPKLTSGSAIQFKITLLDIEPPIWRQIVVPDRWTLLQLHQVIQVTMGWLDCHLHAFVINGVEYTNEESIEQGELEEPMAPEDHIQLRTIARQPGMKFRYTYDFGDGWEHEIEVEKVVPYDLDGRYPVCLDGARACPPEDCGSVPGYESIVEAVRAAKKTKEQKALLKWVGRDYDPERFDATDVDARLAKLS